jgi:S1-C subfamily serine protease
MTLTACTTSQPKSGLELNDPSSNSVKITNMTSNHGGTGIIVRSNSSYSLVLTNSHVCGVVEFGGLVAGRAGTFMVSSYKKSQTHDLCLIKVLGNLEGHAKLANRAPVPYYETALISGHPALFPNVKTRGHFSGRQSITVFIGFRPCAPEDLDDEERKLACLIIGGIPLLKNYDSVLVTATIMPGSSGSAVYNKDGELSGVVFAGSGELGYAWTVPYEYVRYFLVTESNELPFMTPTNLVDLGSNGARSYEKTMMQKLEETCDSPDKYKLKHTCDLLKSQLLM